MEILDNVNFPNLKEKTIRVMQKLEMYHIVDLNTAIYCINSWIDNRSCLENLLILNNSIRHLEKTGDRKIQNYNDFKEFFKEITKILKEVPCELITRDFGEVKIKFKNKFYPVIIGTGHENTYSALMFIEQLSNNLNNLDKVEKVFIYQSKIIEKLSKSNMSKYKENDIRYECPPKAYYESVVELFESELFKEIDTDVVKLLENSEEIEKTHFFSKDDKVYPLFNTSILVDIYLQLISSFSEIELQEIIEKAIKIKINKLYNSQGKNVPKVFIGAGIFANNERRLICRSLFVAFIKNKIIIVLENKEKKSLEEIKKVQREGKLEIINGIEAKGKGGFDGFTISNKVEIYYIIYENTVDISRFETSELIIDDRLLDCSTLDIMFLICFLDDLKNICEFIDYNYNQTTNVIVFGGISNLYVNWIESNKIFSRGAIKPSFLCITTGRVEEYIYNFFKYDLINYPFNIDVEMFDEVHKWKILKENEKNISQYISKPEDGFKGYLVKLRDNSHIFFTINFKMFDKNNINKELNTKINIMDDIHLNFIKEYLEDLKNLEILNNKLLQIAFLPMKYAKKVDKKGFLMQGNKKYVFSELYGENNHLIIRFSVDFEQLLERISNAKNKSVELEYIKELFEPLAIKFQNQFAKIYSKLEVDTKNKKTVDFVSLKAPFYSSAQKKKIEIKDETLYKVRKRIAEICSCFDIQNGKFYGKQATEMVRKIQNALISDLEKEIYKYDRLELHIVLLSLYATAIEESYIHRIRYNNFKDIKPEVLLEIKEKVIKYREINKEEKGYIEFLIESNLCLIRNSMSKCSNNELEYLMAYAYWLNVLQANSDYCYHNSTEIGIEITYEYNINTLISKKEENRIEEIKKRKYENKDYSIVWDEEDKEYMKKIHEAFFKDLGFKLEHFMWILEYLSGEFSRMEEEFEELECNVIKLSIDDIVQDLNNVIDEFLTKKDISLIIDYIKINIDKIKEINNVEQERIPIWEREKRDNRIDLKPIICHQNENIIFSPIVIFNLLELWRNGLTDFYPPFEINLDNTIKVIEEWKRKYEQKMVYDIKNLFSKKGFKYVEAEVKLHKLDKESKHSKGLGDYDVIAIDEKQKKIYLIESKVLRKTGSIYEFSMQQKSFFKQHKEDEKFQRRIDYMKENHIEIFKSIGIETKKFEIVSYMVTNTIFYANEKHVKFPIVSFDELKKILLYNEI